MLVHTGALLIESDSERKRCIGHNRDQVAKAWKGELSEVAVDFETEEGSQPGVDELKKKIATLLPIIAQINVDQKHSSREENNFGKLKAEVLWYAGVAGASDAAPGLD